MTTSIHEVLKDWSSMLTVDFDHGNSNRQNYLNSINKFQAVVKFGWRLQKRIDADSKG